jgi:hypothetical protein
LHRLRALQPPREFQGSFLFSTLNVGISLQIGVMTTSLSLA